MTDQRSGPLDTLTPRARELFLRAQQTPLSFGVRALVSPEDRLVMVLGEAHLKLGAASSLGREIVESVALRGVETFQSKRIFTGRLLRWLIHFPRKLLRVFTMGFVKDSTIIDAKQASHGHTVEIERSKYVPLSLHVAALYLTGLFSTLLAQMLLAPLAWLIPPLHGLYALLLGMGSLFSTHMLMLIPAVIVRKHRWSWLLHPLIAILTARDTLMADGTVRMLEDYPKEGPALVIMGRAHLPGFERELVERHGFRRIPFPADHS